MTSNSYTVIVCSQLTNFKLVNQVIISQTIIIYYDYTCTSTLKAKFNTKKKTVYFKNVCACMS